MSEERKKNVSHFDYQIEFENENYVGYGIIECHKNVIGDIKWSFTNRNAFL